MRDYGRVYSSFWSSADIRSLSDDGKLLAVYLLSCSHGTLAGVSHLPNGYVCEDMGWPPERVSQGFEELSRGGFATRCEATKWVWVIKFLDWAPAYNVNQWKAARKIADSVRDECSWKADFLHAFAVAAGDAPTDPNPSESVLEGSPNHSGTVPKGLLKGSPKGSERVLSGSGSGTVNETETGSGSGSVAGRGTGAGSDARKALSLQERIRANGNQGAKP